jgi:hypothetical protein
VGTEFQFGKMKHAIERCVTPMSTVNTTELCS